MMRPASAPLDATCGCTDPRCSSAGEHMCETELHKDLSVSDLVHSRAGPLPSKQQEVSQACATPPRRSRKSSMQLRYASSLALALLASVGHHAAAAAGDNTTAVASMTAAAGNSTKGATAAQSMGIPVDMAALAASPGLANVPVGPPPTDSSSFVLDQAFTAHINASAVTGEPERHFKNLYAIQCTSCMQVVIAADWLQ